MGKGEIACQEQFSFSHSVLKRLLLQTCKSWACVWERVNRVEKKCGEWRKFRLSLFSPFPAMFSEGVFPRDVKHWYCCKGLVVLKTCRLSINSIIKRNASFSHIILKGVYDLQYMDNSKFSNLMNY